MPNILPYAETRKQRNAYDSWYHKSATADGAKKHAFLRLKEDVFTAHHTPKFRLSKDDAFFLMGSCFARGLERILSVRGFDVRSISDEFNRMTLQYEKGSAIAITNRYNTASILNDVTWHIQDGGISDDTLIETREGLFFDPHATPVAPPCSLEDQQMRRGIWANMCSNMTKVNVFVITLGLVEVWYDKQTGLYCNSAPDARLAMKYPDRFEMHILNYQDNYQNLEKIYSTIKAKNPDMRFIVTVSPVPLLKTFSGEDVVQANMYSKSTLRAVAGDFCRQHDDVDYFPSYEIAMNSDRGIVWAEDKRHVQGSFSRQIMNQFLGHYLGEVGDLSGYDVDVLA